MDNNIYNGIASIMLKKRPFFSIVVPCYNSRKTIGKLLRTIAMQGMNDEIEVILSDDCSTESYQDIVNVYSKILSIKQIQTDYNFGPGNTREKGISVVEGEWLCFADHDDEFIVNSLQEIKEKIILSGEKYYVVTKFYEVDPDTREVIKEYHYERNLLHGKFFNLDNFWKKHDLHFKKDLKTHEDIHLLSHANYASIAHGTYPLYIDSPIYCWMAHENSLSRKRFKEEYFKKYFFKDYIDATGYSYRDCFIKYNADYDFTKISMIEVLAYCYFYIQGMKFYNNYNLLVENEKYTKQYLITVKEMFNVTNKQIVEFASMNEATAYVEIRKSANLYVGTFIESETFIQFLNRLHEDDQIRETMSQVMKKEYL